MITAWRSGINPGSTVTLEHHKCELEVLSINEYLNVWQCTLSWSDGFRCGFSSVIPGVVSYQSWMGYHKGVSLEEFKARFPEAQVTEEIPKW